MGVGGIVGDAGFQSRPTSVYNGMALVRLPQERVVSKIFMGNVLPQVHNATAEIYALYICTCSERMSTVWLNVVRSW